MNQKSYYYEVYFKCFCDIYQSNEKKRLGDLVIVNCDYTSGQFNVGFIVRQALYEELKIDPQTGVRKKPTKIRSTVPPEDEESIRRVLRSKLSAENYVLSVAKLNLRGVKEGETFEVSELLAADFQYDRKKLKIFLKKNSSISICRLVRKLYQIFKVRIKILEIEDVPKLRENMHIYQKLSKLDVMNYDNSTIEESSLFLGSIEKLNIPQLKSNQDSQNLQIPNEINHPSEHEQENQLNQQQQPQQQQNNEIYENQNQQQHEFYKYQFQQELPQTQNYQQFEHHQQQQQNNNNNNYNYNDGDNEEEDIQQFKQLSNNLESSLNIYETNSSEYYDDNSSQLNNFHDKISTSEISQLNQTSNVCKSQTHQPQVNQTLKSSMSWETYQSEYNNQNNTSDTFPRVYPPHSSKSLDSISYSSHTSNNNSFRTTQPPPPLPPPPTSQTYMQSRSMTSNMSEGYQQPYDQHFTNYQKYNQSYPPNLQSNKTPSYEYEQYQSELKNKYYPTSNTKTNTNYNSSPSHSLSSFSSNSSSTNYSLHPTRSSSSFSSSSSSSTSNSNSTSNNQYSNFNYYHDSNIRDNSNIPENYYYRSYLDSQNDNNYYQYEQSNTPFTQQQQQQQQQQQHYSYNKNVTNRNNQHLTNNTNINLESQHSNKSHNRNQALYGSRYLNNRYNLQQSLDEISSNYSNKQYKK